MPEMFGYGTKMNNGPEANSVLTGFGLRFDLEYFFCRLDAAIPLRKPYLPDGDKWIVNDSGFLGEYILSLAVGYPF
jgi:hypothetical protein